MPNLVLLVAVVAYVLAHVPAGRLPELWQRVTYAVEHKSVEALLGLLGVVFVTGFVLVQVPTATRYGLNQARSFNQQLTNGARYLANFNRVPAADRPCYDTAIFDLGVFMYGLAPLRPSLRDAQEDRLSLFAAGPNRTYRAAGVPPLYCPKVPVTDVITPVSGAIVSDTIVLRATAPNATHVEFALFGGRYYGLSLGTAASTSDGWIDRWNTTSVANGSYLLIAEAFNSGGKGVSPKTNIVVHNEQPRLR